MYLMEPANNQSIVRIMAVVTNRKSTDQNVPFVRARSSNQLYFCESEAFREK